MFKRSNNEMMIKKFEDKDAKDIKVSQEKKELDISASDSASPQTGTIVDHHTDTSDAEYSGYNQSS